MKSTLCLVLALVAFRAVDAAPGVNAENKVQLGSRIVGGSYVIRHYPYQVSLKDDSDKHFCGGAIITLRTILTAAHCITGRSTTDTFVVVGTNLLDTGGTKYSAIHVRPHPSYNAVTKQADIGLIILSQNITLGAVVQTINLGYGYLGDNVIVTLTGWGSDTTPDGIITNLLKVINLKTISRDICSNSLNGIGSIYESSICTLNRAGDGVCVGDGGSPLVSEGNVIGIVSWSVECAKGYPDVFTRVGYYTSWIDSNKV